MAPLYRGGRYNQEALASDWQPSPEDVAWAVENYQATPEQAVEEAVNFRDHHLSKGTPIADQSAAWRRWWKHPNQTRFPRRQPANGSAAAAGKGTQSAASPLPSGWWRNPAAVKALSPTEWRILFGQHPCTLETFGPNPDMPGCVWPAEIQAEWSAANGQAGAT